MPLRPNLIQIWKHMFKRWWNSGLNTCHGMLEQLTEMTERWLTSKHVCASHWAWGSQARIADAQSEDQTDLTARECKYFPKMSKYFLPIFLEYFLQILLDSLRVRIFPKHVFPHLQAGGSLSFFFFLISPSSLRRGLAESHLHLRTAGRHASWPILTNVKCNLRQNITNMRVRIFQISNRHLHLRMANRQGQF